MGWNGTDGEMDLLMYLDMHLDRYFRFELGTISMTGWIRLYEIAEIAYISKTRKCQQLNGELVSLLLVMGGISSHCFHLPKVFVSSLIVHITSLKT